MPPVSLKYIVSFSSQDELHTVSNLTKSSDGLKKWLSHPKDKSGQIEAVFQLEDKCVITYIDIGLIWCAMLEVQVGCSDWPQGRDYKTLIPTVSIMSPMECRNGNNSNRTRMFGSDHFSEAVAKESWDRIRMICRQPFRKDVQYGLSFIRIKSSNSPAATSETEANKQQKSVKSIHKHFFGKGSKSGEKPDELKSRLLKIAGSGENGTFQEESLSRTAKLVMAASGTGGSKVPIATGSSPSSRPALHSNHVAQKYGPQFEKEVGDFLCSYNIDASQLDQVTIAGGKWDTQHIFEDQKSLCHDHHLSIILNNSCYHYSSRTVPDIRHKFEKLKKRKLSPEEKKVFISLAKEYICVLFTGNEDTHMPHSDTKDSTNKRDIPSILSESDRNILNQKNSKEKMEKPKAAAVSGIESRVVTARKKLQTPDKSTELAVNEGLNHKLKFKRNFSPKFTNISPHGKKVLSTPPSNKTPGKTNITPTNKNRDLCSPDKVTNDQWLNTATPPMSVGKKGGVYSGETLGQSTGKLKRKRGTQDLCLSDGMMSKTPKHFGDDSVGKSVFPGSGKKLGGGRGRGRGRKKGLDLSREITPTSFERCSYCQETFSKEQITQHRLECQRGSGLNKNVSDQSKQSLQTGQLAGGFLLPFGYYSERNTSDVVEDPDDVVYKGTTAFSDQYVECPLCGEFFRQCAVERHAATCCV